MARIYAKTDAGERFLVAIECDACDRRAKPGSEELLREWQKRGVYYGSGSDMNAESDFCPDHASDWS